jgi:methylthioribose-1-phosphate isomerase
LRLPHRVEYRKYGTCEGVANAIRTMVIRGAPAIGIAAGFGLALEAKAVKTRDPATFLDRLRAAGDMLAATRPTAVNLAWAVRRVLKSAGLAVFGGVARAREAVFAEALKIFEEDRRANIAMGRNGAALVPKGARILTHCNAGALAVGSWGTAVGVIRSAHAAGKGVSVLVDETRPYLQGARLTAWELKQYGIPHHLITDSMAGHFMSRGEVDLVIAGADRIAANGDTANKIGTYSLAVLAREHKIPFFIAAPASTFDLSIRSGREIPIEERAGDEVTHFQGRLAAPEGTPARHPAFDVTPAKYITAIITERGVIRNPGRIRIRRMMKT